MAVSLMAYVPHNTVFGCIVNIMKGNSYLCHAEARCQMARVHCYLFHNILSEFITELWQLIYLQVSKVFWGLDPIQ